MKIQDDARWLAQRAELGQKIGSQSAQVFVGFVEEWCDGAEYIMSYYPKDVIGVINASPIQGLRQALSVIEERHGYLDTNLLANMLVVICANWAYGGDDLFESMTEFEKRLVVDVTGQILAEQQESAEDVPVPDEGLQVPTDVG